MLGIFLSDPDAHGKSTALGLGGGNAILIRDVRAAQKTSVQQCFLSPTPLFKGVSLLNNPLGGELMLTRNRIDSVMSFHNLAENARGHALHHTRSGHDLFP